MSTGYMMANRRPEASLIPCTVRSITLLTHTETILHVCNVHYCGPHAGEFTYMYEGGLILPLTFRHYHHAIWFGRNTLSIFRSADNNYDRLCLSHVYNFQTTIYLNCG